MLASLSGPAQSVLAAELNRASPTPRRMRPMNLELTNKIALVTGASNGIGAATAKVFAEEGADVVLGFDQDREGASLASHAVQSHGRQSWLYPMNISRPEAVIAAVERLKEDVSQIDILVHCAGYNVITPYSAITVGEWEKVVGINLNGAFYVVQAVAPLMRPGGAIVTVASVAAHTGAPHHMHYAAAKAGLVNLTKSLARALAPGIRVNCVSPGITRTRMGAETIATLSPEYAEEKLLVQRYAEPREIAQCIVFVASPVAGFMSGATIDINGGRDLR
jgi:3-oxoacyl-[acyl-carrier protein] reductase